MELEGATGDAVYPILLHRLLASGEPASPRGLPTRELLDVTIRIGDPARAVPHVMRPGLSERILATETAQLVAGVSSLRQLNAATRGDVFSRYAANGRLRGAYGPRLHRQLPRVERQLRVDPDTRQAVAVMWRPDPMHGDEPALGSDDVPCTVALTFRVRNGHLGLKVHMRSSDAWLGLPYDWAQFTRVQLLMCGVLGLAPGPYVHHADSLHVYESDADRAHGAAHDARLGPRREHPPAFGAGFRDWQTAQSIAIGLLFEPDPLHVPEALRWYHSRIRTLDRARERTCAWCRYVVPDREMATLDACVECYAGHHA